MALSAILLHILMCSQANLGENIKLTQLASCISKYVIALNIANDTNDDY